MRKHREMTRREFFAAGAGVAILKDLGSNDAVMKPAVFAQEQIARAVELGLGVSSAADIVIDTPSPASKAYAEKIRAILNA